MGYEGRKFQFGDDDDDTTGPYDAESVLGSPLKDQRSLVRRLETYSVWLELNLYDLAFN